MRSGAVVTSGPEPDCCAKYEEGGPEAAASSRVEFTAQGSGRVASPEFRFDRASHKRSALKTDFSGTPSNRRRCALQRDELLRLTTGFPQSGKVGLHVPVCLE